jgi:hypothetical protein
VAVCKEKLDKSFQEYYDSNTNKIYLTSTVDKSSGDLFVSKDAIGFYKWVNSQDFPVKIEFNEKSRFIDNRSGEFSLFVIYLAQQVSLAVAVEMIKTYLFNLFSTASARKDNNAKFSIKYRVSKNEKQLNWDYDGPVEGLEKAVNSLKDKLK